MLLQRYPIVTLCGSLKFWGEVLNANAMLALKDIISIPSGFSIRHIDQFPVVSQYVQEYPVATKKRLDALHLQKIIASSAIWVLNKNDYIGDSTKREIQFAREIKRFIFTIEECQYCEDNSIKYEVVPLNINHDFPDYLYELISYSGDDIEAIYSRFVNNISGD